MGVSYDTTVGEWARDILRGGGKYDMIVHDSHWKSVFFGTVCLDFEFAVELGYVVVDRLRYKTNRNKTFDCFITQVLHVHA